MTTRYVDPFPYKGGIFRSGVGDGGEGGGAGATGIWYAYFEPTVLPADSSIAVVGLGGIGTSGNAAPFTSLADGVQFTSTVIVQATAWGLVNEAASENKWLGIQLDKGGTLLTRAHTAFHQHAANITYGGVLAEGDILRAVGSNHAAAEDSILEGWISIIVTPI